MSMAKYMDEDDVIRKAIEVLLKELSPIETIRFINTNKKGPVHRRRSNRTGWTHQIYQGRSRKDIR
jgi:hypothetical protein